MFSLTADSGYLRIYIPSLLTHLTGRTTCLSFLNTMIMIVDDNEGMRTLMKRTLAGMGHEFCECSDGAEVNDMYARHNPEWVLMDIEMNGTDGIAAARVLKRSFPSARIVIVTEYNDFHLRKLAEKAGAYGYVLKESLTDLQTVISQELL